MSTPDRPPHSTEGLLAGGLAPNTTTYNALISAYSRAGWLDMAMAAFEEMVACGCERRYATAPCMC